MSSLSLGDDSMMSTTKDPDKGTKDGLDHVLKDSIGYVTSTHSGNVMQGAYDEFIASRKGSDVKRSIGRDMYIAEAEILSTGEEKQENKQEVSTKRQTKEEYSAYLLELRTRESGSVTPNERTLNNGRESSSDKHNLSNDREESSTSKVSAYARLDFDNFTFFLQTLQVVLGRKSQHDLLQASQNAVDVHLSSKKAISRRHAKIFYNFGTQRFELSVLGRNGAFIDDSFVEKGLTVPLVDGSKIQIGNILFTFVLPCVDATENDLLINGTKPFNPADAINLRSNIYHSKSRSVSHSPTPSAVARSSLEAVQSSEKNRLTAGNKGLPLKNTRGLYGSRNHSSSNEEINHILKEFGEEDEKIAEEMMIDPEIRSILDVDETKLSNHHDTNSDQQAALSIPQLHSTDEINENSASSAHHSNPSIKNDDGNTLDMNFSELDLEIATLAPLINAHNEGFVKQEVNQRNHLDLKRYAETPSADNLSSKESLVDFNNHALKRTPMMGRPAVPRMGKPASIQPPAAKYYSRLVSGGQPKEYIDSRYKQAFPNNSGLPAHLVVQGTNSGLALKLAEGTMSHLLTSSPNRAYHTHYNGAPALKVSIGIIPLQKLNVKKQSKAITITKDIKLPPVMEPKAPDNVETTQRLIKRKKEKVHEKKHLKNVSMEEMHEHYRAKPTLTYPAMIVNVLKNQDSGKGQTIPEIIDAIKVTYPYYNFCPDSWQLSVNHIVTLNKMFKRAERRSDGSGWAWQIDQKYLDEREMMREKLKEIAAIRAKEASMKSEEMRLKNREDLQQFSAADIMGRGIDSRLGINSFPGASRGSEFMSLLQNSHLSIPFSSSIGGQKPKSIAELASEIRRDGYIGSKAPLYFKPQSTLHMNSNGELVKRNDTPATISSNALSTSNLSIKEQLESNRSHTGNQTNRKTSNESPAGSKKPDIDDSTKKSLFYLQKELFTLYKAKKLSYDASTTTELITKALTTTITQVNVIGSKAGCGENALSFLVERAPQQVSKILDIALTKVIKEKQAPASLGKASREASPHTAAQLQSSIGSSSSLGAATKELHSVSQDLQSVSPSERNSLKAAGEARSLDQGSASSASISANSEKANLHTPQSVQNKAESWVIPDATDPTSSRSLSSAQSTLTKPSSFSKPPSQLKPPLFLSNATPSRPSYHSAARPSAFTSNKVNSKGTPDGASASPSSNANSTHPASPPGGNHMKRPIDDIGNKEKVDERQTKIVKLD